ncbi:hypothetical protein [Streptomyces ipomoeae]|uniref:hypothetical protein n=1 Tax=Streptomyces ipomoeae TaxID=103232 RepID=UPI001146CBE9|nr:hypothetical protein [Streptomyces ipomoeae]MDX2938603.1 hypothetical protein [Streptomyces ipomoeae]TQE21376.1 hypothetical protein SipoB123_26065 [Streptomyces ipomoeae]
MGLRSTQISVAAAAVLALVAPASAATADEQQTRSSHAASSDIATVLASLRDRGIAQGAGTLDDLTRQASAPSPAATAKAKLPKCRGTFRHVTGTVTLQESKKYGIPWGVKLSKKIAPQGIIRFKAQIFANKREANVYAPHTEPWNYHFHGPLPRTFDPKGKAKKYTIKRGDEVSFLWTWKSVSKPKSGGYRFVNCKFSA